MSQKDLQKADIVTRILKGERIALTECGEYLTPLTESAVSPERGIIFNDQGYPDEWMILSGTDRGKPLLF